MPNKMKSEQDLIASIITNTKRSYNYRNLSIYEIAIDIASLRDLKGNLKEVAEIAKISLNMLGKFLAVFKLSEASLNLVKSRVIDSVEIVYSLAKYPPETQNEIAQFIIDGKLKSQDVRALSSYIKANPNQNTVELIDKFLSTKNIKVSVLKFPVQDGFQQEDFCSSMLQILGNENLLSIEFDNKIGTLKILKEGEIVLRRKAKENNFNLNQYMDWLIKLHTT
jgi:hypothetical protein